MAPGSAHCQTDAADPHLFGTSRCNSKSSTTVRRPTHSNSCATLPTRNPTISGTPPSTSRQLLRNGSTIAGSASRTTASAPVKSTSSSPTTPCPSPSSSHPPLPRHPRHRIRTRLTIPWPPTTPHKLPLRRAATEATPFPHPHTPPPHPPHRRAHGRHTHPYRRHPKAAPASWLLYPARHSPTSPYADRAQQTS